MQVRSRGTGEPRGARWRWRVPVRRTLVRYSGLSERTVRTCLDRRIIAPCDPHIGSARIKRADRRPREWGLDLTLVREDVADEHACGPEHHPPLAAASPLVSAGQAMTDTRTAGGRRTPRQSLWLTRPARCGSCTPKPEWGAASVPAGCDRRSHGVQRLHPNRPRNHPPNCPPPARVRARHRLAVRRMAAARSASSSPFSGTAEG